MLSYNRISLFCSLKQFLNIVSCPAQLFKMAKGNVILQVSVIKNKENHSEVYKMIKSYNFIR